MKVEKSVLDEFMKKFNQMPHRCPVCGCEKFGVNDAEIQMLSLNRQGNNIIMNGKIDHLPTITTYCMHCGHVDQFAIPVFTNSPVK